MKREFDEEVLVTKCVHSKEVQPYLSSPEPGTPIVSVICPCCCAKLDIQHGDDPGRVRVVAIHLVTEVSKERVDNK